MILKIPSHPISNSAIQSAFQIVSTCRAYYIVGKAGHEQEVRSLKERLRRFEACELLHPDTYTGLSLVEAKAARAAVAVFFKGPYPTECCIAIWHKQAFEDANASLTSADVKTLLGMTSMWTTVPGLFDVENPTNAALKIDFDL